MAVDLAGEAENPKRARIAVPAASRRDKILRNHPELAFYLADVLRARSFHRAAYSTSLGLVEEAKQRLTLRRIVITAPAIARSRHQ